MNSDTAMIATTAAIRPASMLSCPSSGPIVRSSRNLRPAGSAPARSSTASSVLASTVKLPVMIPDPPGIADWIVGAEITSLSSTMAKGWPMLLAVYSPNTRAPDGLNRKLTAGRPFWSKAGCASTRSSPETTGTCSIT